MMRTLFSHQAKAVDQLKTGSILCGGVGSGKSRTAIAYFFTKECGGPSDDGKTWIEMSKPKDLYIITTARKRDTLEWERECSFFMLSSDRESSIRGIKVTIDSWNNIKKYEKVTNSFFIFDEQRVLGSGSWVKSFLKITLRNNWILLSATPGDTWLDYAPVFIANGFYKNHTDFKRQHVVYNTFVKFPKVDHYIEEGRLKRQLKSIMVRMDYVKPTESVRENIMVDFDTEKVLTVTKRWNPFTNQPIKDISEYCFTMRRIVNSDLSRLLAICNLIEKHRKLIIFYNFNYELDILRGLKQDPTLSFAEHNGKVHEKIPDSNKWVYVLQYLSGAEGWNCTTTNAVAFYSLNYSYRIMTQAAGRIDRLNTPFATLYYYYIMSESWIDRAIMKALQSKKDFNESRIKF